MNKKTVASLLALALTLWFGSAATAQDYLLEVSSTTGAPGGTATVGFSLDINTGALDVGGWSIGVCSDPGLANVADPDDISPGVDALAATSGGVLGFHATQVYPEGWTVGAVVDLLLGSFLPPGQDLELESVVYQLNTEGVATLSYCDTLGSPMVETSITVGVDTVVPTQMSGTIDIVAPQLIFTFIAENKTVTYDGATGEGTFDVLLSIEEDPASSGFPNDIQGFSMGIDHDNALLEVIAIEQAGALEGLSLLFFGIPMDLSVIDGATVGVVFSIDDSIILTVPTATPVVRVTYATNPAALMGATGDTVTDLTWVNTLSTPPIENSVVVSTIDFLAEFIHGQITLQPQFDLPFTRGDCNDDELVNIADGIWILNFLFQNGPGGNCLAACDSDGDGSFTTTDAIFIFNYRFLGGPSPFAADGECATDPGADCAVSTSCP